MTTSIALRTGRTTGTFMTNVFGDTWRWPRSPILDLGAGDSPLAQELRGQGVIAVALDPAFAIDAPSNAGGLSVAADGVRLPFPDGAFGAVVAVFSLQHIKDPEACLLEIARVIQDDGSLYCHPLWGRRRRVHRLLEVPGIHLHTGRLLGPRMRPAATIKAAEIAGWTDSTRRAVVSRLRPGPVTRAAANLATRLLILWRGTNRSRRLATARVEERQCPREQHTAKGGRSRFRHLAAILSSWLSVTRLHAAGWLALLGAVGVHTRGQPLSSGTMPQIAVFALLASSLGFSVNNLADADRDRLDPRRSGSPLVNGILTTRQVMGLCIVLTLAACWLLTGSKWPAQGLVVAAVGWSLIVVGNRYQKSVRQYAPLMDLMFGTGMALMVLLGATLAVGEITLRLPLVCIAVIAQMCLLNITAGNLKDLKFDLEAPETTTTAIVLGVRPAEDGRPIYTARYKATVYRLQAAWAVVAVLLALLPSSDVQTGPVPTGLRLLSLLLVSVATADVYSLMSNHRRPTRRGRDVFLFTNFVALLTLSAPTTILPLYILLIAVVGWEATIFGLARLLRRVSPISLATSHRIDNQHDHEDADKYRRRGECNVGDSFNYIQHSSAEREPDCQDKQRTAQRPNHVRYEEPAGRHASPPGGGIDQRPRHWQPRGQCDSSKTVSVEEVLTPHDCLSASRSPTNQKASGSAAEPAPSPPGGKPNGEPEWERSEQGQNRVGSSRMDQGSGRGNGRHAPIEELQEDRTSANQPRDEENTHVSPRLAQHENQDAGDVPQVISTIEREPHFTLSSPHQPDPSRPHQ